MRNRKRSDWGDTPAGSRIDSREPPEGERLGAINRLEDERSGLAIRGDEDRLLDGEPNMLLNESLDLEVLPERDSPKLIDRGEELLGLEALDLSELR